MHLEIEKKKEKNRISQQMQLFSSFNFFVAVSRLLYDITKCEEPFNGKIFLLGGDFRQVLPVILQVSTSLTLASCFTKTADS